MKLKETNNKIMGKWIIQAQEEINGTRVDTCSILVAFSLLQNRKIFRTPKSLSLQEQTSYSAAQSG